jgi:formylglycine-generating enzyme required for sulfatase activity
MPIFGRYEVVSELHAGTPASVFRAKLVDGKTPHFVVKLAQFEEAEPELLRQEVAAFFERVRAQKQSGANPNGHWAFIHHFAKTPGGAFYVSDLYPASVATLLSQQLILTARELTRLVAGIVAGLQTMRSILGRAHGSLKPENILLSSLRLEKAQVALTDPAPDVVAGQVGEAGDLQALGKILFQLIEHRAPVGDSDFTVPSTPQWRRLGPSGEGWRQLCADLLTPQHEKTEGHLDELTALVNKLGVTAPKTIPRWTPRVAVLLLIAALAACGLDWNARRELSVQRKDWIDALAWGFAQPAALPIYQKDPSLRAVMIDVMEAQDPAATAGGALAGTRPWGYFRVRKSLAAAAHIESDLSTSNWPVAAHLLETQHVLEAAAWSQPAAFIASRLTALQPPPGADLNSAILQGMRLDAILRDRLPALMQEWSNLDRTTASLAKSNDAYLESFALLLRTSVANGIQLNENGFTGVEVLQTNSDLASRLQEIAHGGFPANIDSARFGSDVTSHIDIGHPGIADVQNWLEREPLYLKQDSQTANAVAELRRALQRSLDQIAKLNPDVAEQAEIDARRSQIEKDLDSFAHKRFTSRDISDGTFIAQRTRIDSQIESLAATVHQRSDPAPWIASLPKLTTRSDVINAYWEDWKHVLTTSLSEITNHNDLFHTYRHQTDALQKTLLGLDTDFPPVPAGFDTTFAAAATEYRERELGKLLAALEPAHPESVPGEKAVADEYSQWCDNLVALGHDFPIRSELLTLGDNPDQTWKQKSPAFWETPTIQHFVAADLKRLDRLRAISKLARPDLIDAATESTVPEITFAAWELLGGPTISPSWPSELGDLETEKDIRDKLGSMAAGFGDAHAKQIVSTALAEQGMTRWRRFVQSANSQAVLQQAMELKNAFGRDSDLFSGLSPEARFNLALYLGRAQMRQSDDRAAAPVIAALNQSAQELADHKPVQRLLDRLARIQVKEKFSDQNPGDRFTLQVPGANPPFVFQRVEPTDDRPFYLCTTAVSFGQFVGVIQAAGAWDKAAEFSWGVAPGQRDARRGPRVWEWTPRPPFQMVNPLLWLRPDDDNDYAPAFRIDRFNRTALSEDVGGNPSPEHPMQQIPAEAAVYFAGLCGCRLPTASEWRNAYAIFERTVPPERWNLRDQTWDQQRRYAAASTSLTIRWPDEGIFLPEQVTIPMGPDAKARPETDGTLFFRPVNGPGGGTFQELVGNVAQFICEAPDAFDDLQDKSSAAAIRRFLEQAPGSLFVIGGSALSPPDVPLQTPLPLVHSDVGYSDVGFRLAFTAPARSLSERLSWVLAGQSYLWARPAPTTATASH